MWDYWCIAYPIISYEVEASAIVVQELLIIKYINSSNL